MVKLEKLPDHYPIGDFIRIGPKIYKNLFAIGKWHLLKGV